MANKIFYRMNQKHIDGMSSETSIVGDFAQSLAKEAPIVDAQIGENEDYGEGLGPHDEDDQIYELVQQAKESGRLSYDVSTVKKNSRAVQYPGGREADIIIHDDDETVYFEAKLFRFQKGNSRPSKRGFAKVFSPFQDRAGQSFIHDVNKIAESDVRATRALLGIYYRPVDGAGTDITSKQMAEKFASEVDYWTDYSITTDTVATFSGLQHPVHSRGGILTWKLDAQPETFF